MLMIINRYMLVVLFAMFFGLFAPPAFGQINKATASVFVDILIVDVLAAVNADLDDEARFALFEDTFSQYAEVPLIARKALGPSYRSATDAQKAAYQKAFSGYMARFYGGRYFVSFRGAEVVTGDVTRVAGGYLVDSRVTIAGRGAYSTQWQILDVKGTFKVYNIFLEGVSLLSDIRTQIGAILDKNGGDLDKLIVHLRTAK